MLPRRHDGVELAVVVDEIQLAVVVDAKGVDLAGAGQIGGPVA